MSNFKTALLSAINEDRQVGEEVNANETTALGYYPTKEEMYAMADLVAFDDMIHAGYTSQAIRNAYSLAQMAYEPMKRLPEFETDFHDLVRAYTTYAKRRIMGG